MTINACFINLLAGHYGIYGALIQGITEEKWSIIKKWCQILTRSLEFYSFFFLLKNCNFLKSDNMGFCENRDE
jgi:hypothetical protein